ncbi:MAG: 3-oxoacyl-ACP synthase [Chitinophagales bacterium]|nr:MAG: 3-oxoacyl-ACP synthase [Chitinophagales bacterium]
MALFALKNARFCGVASCVPVHTESNYDLPLLTPKERELLVKSTGIEKRRVAPGGICSSDLCVEGARELLKQLNWAPEEISILLFITQTPDYITPASSALIQDRLSLSHGCIALDINLGCSGYVYGLAITASLLNALGGGKALLLAGDISTATISQQDKSTVPIFSDAGSATALEYDPQAPEMFFNLEGDGSRFETIIIPAGGYRKPVDTAALEYRQRGEGIVRNDTHLILNGIDVFNFSVREVPRNVNKLLTFAGTAKNDIDYYVFHQANLIINEAIRKKLQLPADRVPYSLHDFGNTSSATIPVTLTTCLREKLQTSNVKMLLSGFGVGLSWGSALIQTRQICCPQLIEI